MATESTPLCPRCRRLDQVRKVLSIVSEGISIGHFQSVNPVQWQGKTYYLPAEREMTTATLLARRLAPPSRPEKPKYEHESWEKYAPASERARVYSFAIPLALFCLVASCVVAGWILTALFGENVGGGEMVLGYVIWAAISTGSVIIVFLLMALLARVFPPLLKWYGDSAATKKAHATAKSIAQARYAKRLQAYEQWPRAIARWNALYYCARDDGVFLEGSRLVPVEQMHAFLYE